MRADDVLDATALGDRERPSENDATPEMDGVALIVIESDGDAERLFGAERDVSPDPLSVPLGDVLRQSDADGVVELRGDALAVRGAENVSERTGDADPLRLSDRHPVLEANTVPLSVAVELALRQRDADGERDTAPLLLTDERPLVVEVGKREADGRGLADVVPQAEGNGLVEVD